MQPHWKPMYQNKYKQKSLQRIRGNTQLWDPETVFSHSTNLLLNFLNYFSGAGKNDREDLQAISAVYYTKKVLRWAYQDCGKKKNYFVNTLLDRQTESISSPFEGNSHKCDLQKIEKQRWKSSISWSFQDEFNENMWRCSGYFVSCVLIIWNDLNYDVRRVFKYLKELI